MPDTSSFSTIVRVWSEPSASNDEIVADENEGVVGGGVVVSGMGKVGTLPSESRVAMRASTSAGADGSIGERLAMVHTDPSGIADQVIVTSPTVLD